MPLRDHFRSPVSRRSSWEGFHAMLAMEMVRQMATQLPDTMVAEPRVHLGTLSEIPLTPTPGVGTNLPEQYAYEVLIFDSNRARAMVAAIEIVSPANKDRPGHRQLFVAKCADLLQKSVRVDRGPGHDPAVQFVRRTSRPSWSARPSARR